MNIFCLADEDTVRGFRLTGVAGRAVSSIADASLAFKEALNMEALGILILTDVVAAELEEEVERLRTTKATPLIAVIPGPDGPMPGKKSLRQFVQEAVGINVGRDEDSGDLR